MGPSPCRRRRRLTSSVDVTDAPGPSVGIQAGRWHNNDRLRAGSKLRSRMGSVYWSQLLRTTLADERSACRVERTDSLVTATPRQIGMRPCLPTNRAMPICRGVAVTSESVRWTRPGSTMQIFRLRAWSGTTGTNKPMPFYRPCYNTNAWTSFVRDVHG